MFSISSCAPAARMMRRVASMISGPMPSPYATVMGVFFAVSVVVVIARGFWASPRPRPASVDQDDVGEGPLRTFEALLERPGHRRLFAVFMRGAFFVDHDDALGIAQLE